MEQKEMKLVYDTLLSTPGMNENVRVDVRMSRRQVLLLSQLLEKGLEVKGSGLAGFATEEEQESIRQLARDILEKAGLSETDRHLRLLTI